MTHSMIDYDDMLRQLDHKLYSFSFNSVNERRTDFTYNMSCYVLMPLIISAILYMVKPTFVTRKQDDVTAQTDVDIQKLLFATFIASVGMRMILFYTVA